MSKVEVFIYGNYSGGCGTPQMCKITSKGDDPITWRVGEIVDYVKKRAVDSETVADPAKFLKSDPENILLNNEFSDVKEYMYYDGRIKKFLTFNIVNVDTTRPWTIADDGREHIKYLDEVNKINEDLNYWEEKIM